MSRFDRMPIKSLCRSRAWAGGSDKVTTHLVGDHLGECGFPQSWWPVEEHMIQRLLALL